MMKCVHCEGDESKGMLVPIPMRISGERPKSTEDRVHLTCYEQFVATRYGVASKIPFVSLVYFLSPVPPEVTKLIAKQKGKLSRSQALSFQSRFDYCSLMMQALADEDELLFVQPIEAHDSIILYDILGKVVTDRVLEALAEDAA